MTICFGSILCMVGGGAQVQWLMLPAWKVEDRGSFPRSGLHVSSPLTRKDSILVGVPVTQFSLSVPRLVAAGLSDISTLGPPPPPSHLASSRQSQTVPDPGFLLRVPFTIPRRDQYTGL